MGHILLTESAKRYCDSAGEQSRKLFADAFETLSKDPYPPEARRLAQAEGQYIYRSAGVRLVYLVREDETVVVVTAATEAN